MENTTPLSHFEECLRQESTTAAAKEAAFQEELFEKGLPLGFNVLDLTII